MPITHDYLNTSGYKPTVAEADVGELIPNLADGTLWTKNVGGTVIQLGKDTIYTGTAPIDVTGTTISLNTGGVTLSHMADLAANTLIGRSGTTGTPEALSASAARTLLDVKVASVTDNLITLTGVAENATHLGTFTGTTIADNVTIKAALQALETAVDTNTDITQHISVTQAVDLDAIETRVNQLDASVTLEGTWDASVGDFPDALNTSPAAGTITAGMSWIVSTGGTVDGVVFTANDRLVALVDSASNTTYANNWHKLDYTDEVLSVNSQTGAVVLDPDDLDDTSTTHKFVTASDLTNLGNLSGTNTGDQNLFSQVSVSGQTTVTAGSTTEDLEIIAGSGISITTNNTTKDITISSTATGTTNLAFDNRTATQFDITSSSGGDATVTAATSTLAGAMVAADKVKIDHITVTQAVDLDTIESNQVGSLLTGEAV